MADILPEKYMTDVRVLDAGFVQLVDRMGSDLTVVNSARVSFSNQSEWDDHTKDRMILKERDEKLIRYLAKHHHWQTQIRRL